MILLDFPIISASALAVASSICLGKAKTLTLWSCSGAFAVGAFWITYRFGGSYLGLIDAIFQPTKAERAFAAAIQISPTILLAGGLVARKSKALALVAISILGGALTYFGLNAQDQPTYRPLSSTLSTELYPSINHEIAKALNGRIDAGIVMEQGYIKDSKGRPLGLMIAAKVVPEALDPDKDMGSAMAFIPLRDTLSIKVNRHLDIYQITGTMECASQYLYLNPYDHTQILKFVNDSEKRSFSCILVLDGMKNEFSIKNFSLGN